MAALWWEHTLTKDEMRMTQYEALRYFNKQYRCPIRSASTLSSCYRNARVLAGLPVKGRHGRWPARAAQCYRNQAEKAHQQGREDVAKHFLQSENDLLQVVTLRYQPRPQRSWEDDEDNSMSDGNDEQLLVPAERYRLEESRVRPRTGLERWLIAMPSSDLQSMSTTDDLDRFLAELLQQPPPPTEQLPPPLLFEDGLSGGLDFAELARELDLPCLSGEVAAGGEPSPL